MIEKQKQNIVGFILSCILIAYGFILGYIVGKEKGDKEATERHNKLLSDYKYFSSSRDH